MAAFAMPHLAWGQDSSPPQSINLVLGTPLTLGIGLEYEYYLSNAHSFALDAGFAGLLASDIEDTNVIKVQSEFEVDMIYLYYGGRKAPAGAYGMLGFGIYNANTTGGDLTLVSVFGGPGYKWRPIQSFAFAIQGGLGFVSSDEIRQANVTYIVDAGPFLFIGLRFGLMF